MTLRSSFSKEVRSEMRRNIWAPVLSLIGFLFCLPLPVAVILQEYYESITGLSNAISDVEAWKSQRFDRVCDHMADWLTFNNILVSIGIFIMATLCGVAIFRYLHDRRQVDLFHALPVSRTHLFAVRYVTGIVSVLPAYIIIHLVTAAAVFSMGFGTKISFGAVLATIGCNVLFFLCLYAVAILCTVLTGNTVITVVLGLWMSFFIPAFFGLIMLFEQNAYATWYGPSLTIERLMMYGSPLIAYFLQAGEYLFGVNSTVYGGPGMLAYFAVLTVVLTALCLVLFRIRRSERAGAAMAFDGSKLPIKAVVCVILALAGYIFFENIIGSFWSWFGFAVFLVMGHALVEIIYHFDFRKALSHLPHMLLCGAVAAAIIIGINMDITGFDRYRPADDEIAGMRVQIWGDFGAGSVRSNSIRDDHWLTDPELIDDIMLLVDEGILYETEPSSFPALSDDEFMGNIDLSVTWKLENGKRVSRCYNYPITDPSFHNELIGIVNHPDFLRVYSNLQQINMEHWELDLNALYIRTAADANGGVASGSVYDDADIARLVTAMQQAELVRDAELMRNEAPVLRVDIRYTEQERGYEMRCDYLPVYACDTEVIALVKEMTGVEPVVLTPEHVESVQIERHIYADIPTDAIDYEVYYEKYGEIITEAASTREVIDQTDRVVIDDPAIIEELLENGVPAGMMDAAVDWFQTGDLAVTEDGVSVSYGVSVNLQNNWDNLGYTEGNVPIKLLESLFEAE